MSNEQARRASSITAASAAASIPKAPPLPATNSLQRAKDVAYRVIGYPALPSRTPSPVVRGVGNAGRLASLGTQSATTSHKTGLEINTLAVNEKGTHALLGGKEIFKTIRVQDGSCTEELNLRTAIRSTPTQASGKPRQVYSIDIADVAWAKGDCGDYVAAATSSGKIILYDLGHAGLQAAQLHEHYRQVHKVTFNPHRGNLLLSGSQDGTVRLWDIRDARNQASTLQSKRKYSGQSDGVRDVKWSLTDGVDFAFGTDSGDIQRWDIRNLKAAKVKIPAHGLACNSIDWHPDGNHILSAGLDKTARVWDFSSGRKQKPAWEIKTAFPIMNARWRPSCESSMPNDNSARQCTQIVTAYSRDYPVIHVWDYRRPALPFRELTPCTTAPTDLQWHSQDLLWTVGREGIFLQSDIQHASKVIDKRNLQSFDVTAEGDINFVVQKRSQRRIPRLRKPPPPSTNSGTTLSTSPENAYLSRSWADDSLDNSFLSVHPSGPHNSPKKTARMAHNPGAPQAAVIPLNEILNNRQSFQPEQFAGTGRLPYMQDPSIFRFLAEKYIGVVEIEAEITDHFVRDILEAFAANERFANAAGLYRLAQSWKVMGMVTVQCLEARIKYTRELANTNIAMVERTDGQILRDLITQKLNLVQSPASMKAVSLITQQLDAQGSSSSMPTPLAKPPVLPEPDEILTLPPSLGSAPRASPPAAGRLEPLYFLPDVCDVDLEEREPFPLVEMLQEVTRYHVEKGDAQTATHMLTLIGPLLPPTQRLPEIEAEMHIAHYVDVYTSMGYLPDEVASLIEKHIEPSINTGLRPLQIESILSNYHEQLISRRCHIEAAQLRRLAYPAYPSVYEDFNQDNSIYLQCGGCGEPMAKFMAKLQCGRCGASPAQCPLCWRKDSPYGGGKVMTSCLECGHGGHMACLQQWYAEAESGGCCPTEGCLCFCARRS